MSDFGDFDNDDAFDTEPADPLQVAIKLHRLRKRLGWESDEWETFNDNERDELVGIARGLLDWLRRQGGIR